MDIYTYISISIYIYIWNRTRLRNAERSLQRRFILLPGSLGIIDTRRLYHRIVFQRCFIFFFPLFSPRPSRSVALHRFLKGDPMNDQFSPSLLLPRHAAGFNRFLAFVSPRWVEMETGNSLRYFSAKRFPLDWKEGGDRERRRTDFNESIIRYIVDRI